MVGIFLAWCSILYNVFFFGALIKYLVEFVCSDAIAVVSCENGSRLVAARTI